MDGEAVTTQLRHSGRNFGFRVVRLAEHQDNFDAYFSGLRLYTFAEKQMAGMAKKTKYLTMYSCVPTWTTGAKIEVQWTLLIFMAAGKVLNCLMLSKVLKTAQENIITDDT